MSKSDVGIIIAALMLVVSIITNKEKIYDFFINIKNKFKKKKPKDYSVFWF